MTPGKFAETVMKSLDGALIKVYGTCSECPTTVPAGELKQQLEAKAALFLGVIDRANKAVNKKAKSKGVTDKQYTTQLFEGLLSDTHGINKKSRETHVSLLARVIYHLIRENADLEDDMIVLILQTV
jgi:hypothetical protein